MGELLGSPFLLRRRGAACRRLPQRRRERRGRGEIGIIKNAKIFILVLVFYFLS